MLISSLSRHYKRMSKPPKRWFLASITDPCQLAVKLSFPINFFLFFLCKIDLRGMVFLNMFLLIYLFSSFSFKISVLRVKLLLLKSPPGSIATATSLVLSEYQFKKGSVYQHRFGSF